MINNVTGSLIEMNAHSYLPSYAQALTILGIMLGVVLIVYLISELIVNKKWTRLASLLLVLILLCVMSFCIGYTRPREKIIMACANGPVSIEEISTRYDIVEIDGKLIRLKERR